MCVRHTRFSSCESVIAVSFDVRDPAPGALIPAGIIPAAARSTPEARATSEGGVEQRAGQEDDQPQHEACDRCPSEPAPSGGEAIVARDLDADGAVDLVVLASNTLVDVLRGNGNGTFDGSDSVFSFGLNSDTFLVGDWNGSHTSKIGVVRPGADGVPVFSLDTNGDGTFGAGDTVTAYLATMLAAGATPAEAAVIANFAAGVEVAKLGAATVSIDEVIDAYDLFGAAGTAEAPTA